MTPTPRAALKISLIPTDPSPLPVALLADMPVPTSEYVIVPCDYCGKDGWMGPRQQTAREALAGLRPVETMCYVCMFTTPEGIAAALSSGRLDLSTFQMHMPPGAMQ